MGVQPDNQSSSSRQVGLYPMRASLRGEPAKTLAHADARALVEAGIAAWRNRATAVQLIKPWPLAA